MRKISIAEEVSDYTHAILSNTGRTYGLYRDADTAKRIAGDLCKRYGADSYEAFEIEI